MNTRIPISAPVNFISPEPYEPQAFNNATEAVDALTALYERNTDFLIDAFGDLAQGGPIAGRYRAFYPQVALETTSFGHIDTRLAYGHVTSPGLYTTTITRPTLFRHYLKEQLGHLMRNHQVPVIVSESATPIPLHFAFAEGAHVEASAGGLADMQLRDVFDTPDLAVTDDEIANGEYEPKPGEPHPLAPFTAQRIDYSLARLSHYTATSANHFQNFVLFTNYQFYVDEFCAYARKLMADGGEGYTAFVEPGNIITKPGDSEPSEGVSLGRLPQMPAYHLKMKGHAGITLVNIGVGPSNAKTITDHIAVLRPHAWLMLGHPVFRDKIREWLKVLRKANCAVVLATQSISDAERSGIIDVLKESCPTKICLPNGAARESGTREFYERIGFNPRQIEIVAAAIPKREYYVTSPDGRRLFDMAALPLLRRCFRQSRPRSDPGTSLNLRQRLANPMAQ